MVDYRDIYWVIMDFPYDECWVYASETGNIHLDDDDFLDDDDSDSMLYFNPRSQHMFIHNNFLCWTRYSWKEGSSIIKLGRDYKTS